MVVGRTVSAPVLEVKRMASMGSRLDIEEIYHLGEEREPIFTSAKLAPHRKSVHRVFTTNIMKSPIKSVWKGEDYRKKRRSITASAHTGDEPLAGLRDKVLEVGDFALSDVEEESDSLRQSQV